MTDVLSPLDHLARIEAACAGITTATVAATEAGITVTIHAVGDQARAVRDLLPGEWTHARGGVWMHEADGITTVVRP